MICLRRLDDHPRISKPGEDKKKKKYRKTIGDNTESRTVQQVYCFHKGVNLCFMAMINAESASIMSHLS